MRIMDIDQYGQTVEIISMLLLFEKYKFLFPEFEKNMLAVKLNSS